MLFIEPTPKKDHSNKLQRLAGTAILSAALTSLWPGLIIAKCEEAWARLAIRLGLRTKQLTETESHSMTRKNAKAVRDTENVWQLEGESDLAAITIPAPPVFGTPTVVRLTHSNSCGPFDEAEFFVRLGDPNHPTDESDLDSATDWIKAQLVEELVNVDGDEIFRSEAEEPFEDETPWDGTYEAQLIFQAGRRLVEIKIVSRRPKLIASRVLADWDVTVA